MPHYDERAQYDSVMGRPVRVRTVLDRKFTGTASAASSSWVEFPTNRQKNPASHSILS